MAIQTESASNFNDNLCRSKREMDLIAVDHRFNFVEGHYISEEDLQKSALQQQQLCHKPL